VCTCVLHNYMRTCVVCPWASRAPDARASGSSSWTRPGAIEGHLVPGFPPPRRREEYTVTAPLAALVSPQRLIPQDGVGASGLGRIGQHPV